METQKIPNSQSNIDKEKESGFLTSDYTTKLQSHKNCRELTQKQKYISVELNRKPRNKSMNLWSINLLQRKQEYIIKTVSSISVVRKTGQLYVKI